MKIIINAPDITSAHIQRVLNAIVNGIVKITKDEPTSVIFKNADNDVIMTYVNGSIVNGALSSTINDSK